MEATRAEFPICWRAASWRCRGPWAAQTPVAQLLCLRWERCQGARALWTVNTRTQLTPEPVLCQALAQTPEGQDYCPYFCVSKAEDPSQYPPRAESCPPQCCCTRGPDQTPALHAGTALVTTTLSHKRLMRCVGTCRTFWDRKMCRMLPTHLPQRLHQFTS